MPVHNERRHIDDSVASILRQTHADFEFVIGDNGSTDGTHERLVHWSEQDRRIRLLRHPERLGPARSSDWVVQEARGTLIARMDADDIAHPARLARQIAALERQPDADLIGTLFHTIDDRGRPIRPPRFDLLIAPGTTPPFCHPTILFRRAAFERIGGYRVDANYWEDADLFLRMAEQGRVYVLGDVLMTIRHKAASGRFTEQQDVLEHALQAYYLSLSAYAPTDANKAAAGLRAPPAGKLLPQVFASRAAGAIWAGRRPRVFKRMLARAAFSWDRPTAASLAYVLWGSLAPLSLRSFLVRRLHRMNRTAVSPQAGQLVRWSPARHRSR
jgi:glycosyltransferase involved in cell wall biosynthesis